MINYSNIRTGKNCVIWSRVSTKYQQDNGGSIATQKKICEEYASRNDYSIKYYCGGEHESAKTPGPLIQGMMKKVKSDISISTILISEFDRFSRELWQATKMLQELRELGVIVIACKFGLDTRTKEGMMMAQNTLAMAQWDNQNRTDKFVTGRADCMKAGAWIEKAPRGYYKEGKSRETFCYLDDTGKLIAKAFAWKLQNITNKEILTRLAARGLIISKQEIHKILVNPFYAGKIRHKYTNNELIDGRIEPAVTYADFLKVQDILSGKTGKYMQMKDKENCPLTKHVFCLADNTPLTSYTHKKKTKTHELSYDYYKCRETGCNTNVSAIEMHAKYEALLGNYNLSEDMVAAFADVLREYLRSFAEESIQQSRELKKKISEVDTSLKKIKMRFAEGVIDNDTYQTAIQGSGGKPCV